MKNSNVDFYEHGLSGKMIAPLSLDLITGPTISRVVSLLFRRLCMNLPDVESALSMAISHDGKIIHLVYLRQRSLIGKARYRPGGRCGRSVLGDPEPDVELRKGDDEYTDVYEKLDGSGVNVVGGRTAGPGVGGFTLGGGYSWKTNQFGLTSDTVKLYNIVLTNGTITTASADTNPDLFWALQGGLNKFGVVTSAEFNTHTQPDQIYGGIIIYSTDYNDQIIAATQKFSEVNTDPKAQLITTLNTTPLGSLTFVIYFYDGPDPGNVFSMFDGIESTINLVSTQTFSSFVSLVDSNIQTSPRGSFNTMPTTKLSAGFLAAVANQSQALSNVASNYSGILLSYDVEPFLNYGQYARSSAFPHADSAVPLNLYYSWIGEDNDEFWLSTMQSNVDQLKQVAISEGIFNETAPLYPNYSPSTATLDQLYSSAGAARLREIRSAYDPGLVGDLAGGFSFK
ncbi:hypothetical protein N0V93_006010 [Gnomoniopsis smithogilvyi]|uniref:FAD-binding PCMH-type domain-containing protein n=1 Tax=Gnomoniopsis smithogilvyi TaxID=1191159 RepID=A0A9W9CVB1_9PEZI|nr:hypothetical protein N0V93_006010 [Gnomoniopsis smithogilvyi]